MQAPNYFRFHVCMSRVVRTRSLAAGTSIRMDFGTKVSSKDRTVFLSSIDFAEMIERWSA